MIIPILPIRTEKRILSPACQKCRESCAFALRRFVARKGSARRSLPRKLVARNQLCRCLKVDNPRSFLRKRSRSCRIFLVFHFKKRCLLWEPCKRQVCEKLSTSFTGFVPTASVRAMFRMSWTVGCSIVPREMWHLPLEAYGVRSAASCLK